MTEEDKLKTRVIALIDAQEKFMQTTFESLQEAVNKYKVALEASEPEKREVLRIIEVIQSSCSELDDRIVGSLYDALDTEPALREKYWSAINWYQDVDNSLSPLKMRYASQEEELVDWNSSTC